MYAAYAAAMAHKGQPTVILAKTIKGYTLGKHFEGRNATHQMKKLTLDDLKDFRDLQRIPITDAELEKDPYLPPYYHPGMDAHGDPVHARPPQGARRFPARAAHRRPSRCNSPATRRTSSVRKGSGKQNVATTMALVRLMKELLRDKEIGKRIVPIIPDEARTFGMDSWFPSLKIYNRNGQLYTSVDAELMLAYKESTVGQILHEGINEAGSTASFTAVGTSYATHGEPMIPLYIFYSMFGFQRTGDGLWAAADQMARGFVLGATAGRTTLTGEGLQHADGHSLLLASTNPAVVDLRPGVRVRDRAHRARRSAPDVRRHRGCGRLRWGEHLLLHHPLQRAVRSSPPSRRTSTSTVCSRACTCTRRRCRPGEACRRRRRAQILVSGVTVPDGAAGPGACSPRSGVSAPTCGR